MTMKIGLDTNAIAPFSFDGHGVNDANGQRITKVTSCDPYIYPNGQAVRNAEFDRLSNLLAAAPELLEALERLTKTVAQVLHSGGLNDPWVTTRTLREDNLIALDAIRKARGE